MKIYFISAALPPQIDGIGDYTACLASELANSAEVTVLTGADQPHPIPNVCVQRVFDANKPQSVWNLTGPIERERPDWVLLQYNPFSYGRWGLNLHLPELLHRLKNTHKSNIAVMVHETFTPIVSWQSALMTIWQRRQFERIGHCADILFFSTERSSRVFPTCFPQAKRVHLPVGSNLPCLPISKGQARAELGIADDSVVLGLFGTSHVSRMLNRVREAAETVRQYGKSPVVLYLGPDGKAMQSALGDTQILADGPLAGAEISRRLAAVDIYLAPFTDGISTRRGTVMAGLQHGLPVVGTEGYNTDSLLKSENGGAFLLAKANDAQQFSAHIRNLLECPERGKELGRNGQRFFAENFTWSRIATKLLFELEAAPCNT